MQQHGAKRSKFNCCSEHVAYKTKGNHECSIMVANILPVDPIHLPTPCPTLGMGSKVKTHFFSEYGH